MMGLCRGLAYRAYREVPRSDGSFGWHEARREPTFGLIPSRSKVSPCVANPEATFPTSFRYFALLDACPLRMFPPGEAPVMNDPVMDVCDCCLGDGEFVEYDGDSAPCDACDGTGFVARDAEECDLDYIADCGDPFAVSALETSVARIPALPISAEDEAIVDAAVARRADHQRCPEKPRKARCPHGVSELNHCNTCD